ncbi:MAG: RsmB/NOP family class I SAM-dependent RNA methyltransferase [Devosia sp.]
MAKLKVVPGLKLRQLASARLADTLKGANFAPFSALEIEDGRDRALANRLVTTALRRHGHLDRVIAYLLERGVPKKGGSFETVLRLSLAQLLYLPELGDHSALFLAGEAMKADAKAQHLGKLMNAVLRRAQSEAEKLREAPEPLLFPERLVAQWSAAYGDGAIPAFARALLDGAPLDLTLKDMDRDLIAALGAAPVIMDTVRIVERDKPVELLPGFAEGRFWVQDAAAAIPARLMGLPEGSRVLDLCAAPGGKSAQLSKAGYRVTALDDDAGRMARLKGNLERLAYAAEMVVADGLTYAPEDLFDGVLLDAPCSATGTFRRHPEVIWHRGGADISGRVKLQRQFLGHAASLVKPGGVLIYCVCSLEPQEGEAQAAWALDRNLGLEIVPIGASELGGWADPVTDKGYVRTHPGLTVPGEKAGSLDGFFIARFRKR